MAGLEKIKKEISLCAEEKADSIIKSAYETAEQIISLAREKAEKECSEIAEAADNKVKVINSTSESTVMLDKKNKILFAKTELINASFDKAREYFNSLEKEDYLETVKKLIVFNAVNGEGEIRVNEKGFSFITDGFVKEVSSLLPKEKSLKLSETPDLSLSDGFIIKYDNIEINCEFDSLISFATERLTDTVNGCLFG